MHPQPQLLGAVVLGSRVARSRMRGLLLGLAAVSLAVVACIEASDAGAARTYMSCGYPPAYSPSTGFSHDGRIHYARHPGHCAWSDNSATYRLVNLVGLHWRRWGKRVAIARGKIVDNHDMDENGFQRHPVRIRLSDPRPPVGHSGGPRLYYTRMRVMLPAQRRHSFVEHLFRPGEQPVVFP